MENLVNILLESRNFIAFFISPKEP